MQCSLARTADVVGDKWTLLILRDAFFGLHTFTQFQKNLGVARNILTNRLDKMVADSILEKVAKKPGLSRFDYHLTERGKALYPVVVALLQWGDKWIFGAEGEPVRLLDKKNLAPIQDIAIQARDGRYLQHGDICSVPGPSASTAFINAFEKRNTNKTSQ